MKSARWHGIGARLLNIKNSPVIFSASLAALLSLLVYLRAVGCEFVNYDDYQYIVDNRAIKILDMEFMREAFQTLYMGAWMPLTWFSFAADYYIWGLDPRGYHLTNIMLHVANTALVVAIADRVFRGMGVMEKGEGILYPLILLFAGLVWSLHPLRVESVAWASERKDVLNGVFALSSIYFYLRYTYEADSLGSRMRAFKPYLLCVASFVLSLMAKPVSVVIPAMLLVIDWFPLNRLKNGKTVVVLIEKIPFLMISAAVSLLTIHGASSDVGLISYEVFPFFRRVLTAGNALFEYWSMILYPVGITHLYLLPQYFPVSYYIHTAIIVLFFSVLLFIRTKFPWFTATFVLFLLPLTPVLSFFQSSSEAYAPHFIYLSSVAPSIAAAGIVNWIFEKYKRPSLPQMRFLVIVFSILLLIFYAIITYRLIGTWQNSETLWTRQILIQPVGRAYQLRGFHYLEKGRNLEAADDLLKAIKIARDIGFPGIYNAHAMRGAALNRLGRYEEAVQEFNAAIRLNPQPNYYYHRGLALRALGMKKEADDDFILAGEDTGELGWRVLK